MINFMTMVRFIKNIILVVGMLLMSLVSVGQNTLTVHDGTATNSYVPFYGLWVDDYTRAEIIYPANELSAMIGGAINSITFYKNSSNTNSWGAARFQIHLKEVTETYLSSYISIDGATLVYSGTIDASGGERTVTITFNTPYQYNGGNLLFSVYQTTEGSYSSVYWYGEDATGMSASGYNSSNASSANFNQRNFIPKTTFEYEATECLLSVPYYQDFDGDELPCWYVMDYNDDETWTWIYNGTGHSGDKYMFSYSKNSSPNDYLITPKFYIPDDGNEYFLKWWTMQGGITYNDYYRIYIVVDNTVIDLLGQINSIQSWEEHSISLMNYTNKIVQFYFHHFETPDGWSLYFDDFSIDYCHQPTNIITDGGLTTADVSWDANGDNYTIYVYAENTELIDFENNELPDDFTNDATYPWTIIDDGQSGFNGTYCIKSTNGGKPSTTSVLSVTKTYLTDGTISFRGGCWGEGTSTVWDKCIFEIDGDQQFSYGALQNWNTYTFNVTAGEHTFTWKYSKDGSVNPTGDAFYIDDIKFKTNSLIQTNYSNTNSYMVENLNPASEYIVQIESDCGNTSALSLLSTSFTVPINLLEFYATPDHLTPTPTNNIYIKTGGEWNNCEYIIYRSPDAINWDYDNPVIDWDFSDNPHDASANANYSEYSYMEYYPIDYNPYDTTYYKLIQRDCDNTAHEYTSEIIVCINGKQKKSAWDYFSYTYEGLMVTSNDKPITIICYNILGQMIYQTDILSNDNIILTIKPPYILTIYEDGTPVATEKVFR